MSFINIEVGQLRHRVDVEFYTETQDTAGQPIKNWALYSQRWAAVNDLRGKELFAAQERFATATTEIVMRYFNGLNATMRILHAGTIYNILHVNDVEKKHVKYVVTCETGLNDG
jgi:SPP1 family predicted phage head-tail adaptor